jgi:transglutaminase-like putative cysteine protease
VAWALTWRGQAIGGAWERDTEDHFERRERIVVRRGEDVVISDLAITIERDPAGAPFQVGVTRWQDGPVLDGTAMRSADGGWSVEIEGEQPTQLPTAAPFELVLREGQDFHGDVLLAGWGFAVAHLDLVPAAKVATLYVGGRPLHAEITYDDDRAIASIIGGDGVVARRAPLDADLRPTEPPEVVDGNAIALTGSGSTIAFPDATAPPLPSLPGQRPVSGHPWTVALDPSAESRLLLPELRTRDRTAEIAQLVHQVAVTVIDDLSTTATTTAAARVATHGDCTTHALRFAALAADAGIPVRVVTGLRLDGASLIRHRWNVAWTGTRWITIDPTFDEAPATPALIGLAVHGARAADLAAADATVFDGLGSRAELR